MRPSPDTRISSPSPMVWMLAVRSLLALSTSGLMAICSPSLSAQEELHRVPIQRKIQNVQPMTGIVLWTTNEAVAEAPIQLEYSYLNYSQVVREKGQYDWSVVDRLLDQVASRKHQLILRWYDTYVGKKSGIPQYIQNLADYKTTRGKSENKTTEFPDWSHPELQRFGLDFFSAFSDRYDRDPRIAFVQVGFGLWSEYHIYDGPMKMGQTFPSLEYQSQFAHHLESCFRQTPWMISVDAANDWAPFTGNDKLLKLPFGMFDDSFNHAQHAEQNEPNWKALAFERWKRAPTGGEFSFFESKDQQLALAKSGPHGISFERHAAKFHISFMIGDAQPEFQKPERIREAGMACGYRFRLKRLESSTNKTVGVFQNVGIAPIYFDAFPAIDGIRSKSNLKGLLPGESIDFEIACGVEQSRLTIACDRLVDGQSIEFEADLR